MSAGRGTGERRRERLARARLYFVTEGSIAGRDALETVESALEGGVDVVQLRDPAMDDDGLLAAGREFRRLCERHDALFVVNDRPELAVECAADGVHVGQADAPTAAVREAVGGDALIGLSTHSPRQFDAGLESAADYLCVGPVWETPTKPGRPATGLELVRHAARRDGVPFFAIGGIDVSNVSLVADSGAERIVVVRAIRDAEDPRAAAAALRGALAEAETPHAA